MTTTRKRSARILCKQFALPAEHGSWIWWVGPFLIGIAAGGQINADLGILFIAAIAAFNLIPVGIPVAFF